MEKISIIGCPGSGKSYLAKALKEILNIKTYYLDILYWRENWDHVPKEELKETILNIMLTNDSFIMDGNYINSMEDRFIHSDTIIFLDMPLRVCLKGVRERRNIKREDFPEFLFEEEDLEFTTYIKNFKRDQRKTILKLIKKYRDKNIIIFKRRKDVDKFISSLKNK